MNRFSILLIFFCLPQSAIGSHPWVGIDLCELYADKLPPGLTLKSLPEPQSPGAQLLNQFCTQCHNLPGPDRNTAAEWREVTSKMFMLMDVSHRFGGLMGRVEIMQKEKQAQLLSYLERNAIPVTGRQKLSLTSRPGRNNAAPSGEFTPGSEENGEIDQPDPHWLTRLWVLMPFLAMAGVGLFRWRKVARTGSQHA